jgi:hypothetical protein
MEQSRRPGYEFTQLNPSHFDKDAKKYNGKKTASSTNVAMKSGYLPAEN